MSIEELLREAAAKGLTHFTVWPVHSADNKTVYWTARATPSTAHRYVEAIDLDIITAAEKALVQLPKAPKRAPPKKFDSENPPLSEMAQRAAAEEPAVTAAVNPGDPLDLHDGPNDEWSRFK